MHTDVNYSVTMQITLYTMWRPCGITLSSWRSQRTMWRSQAPTTSVVTAATEGGNKWLKLPDTSLQVKATESYIGQRKHATWRLPLTSSYNFWSDVRWSWYLLWYQHANFNRGNRVLRTRKAKNYAEW